MLYGGKVCEEALADANLVEHVREPAQRAAAELRAYVARQLSAAAVPGLGGSWGGAAAGPAPPPPRCVEGFFQGFRWWLYFVLAAGFASPAAPLFHPCPAFPPWTSL